MIVKSAQTKKRLLRLRSGQAAAEMAIFGSLILICFSVLLTYGQRLDNQQQLKMEAFRKALHKAWERNSAASYTLNRDFRFYNLLGKVDEGQSSRLSSTASVMWQKGSPGGWETKNDSSFAYHQINDAMLAAGESQASQIDIIHIAGDSADTADIDPEALPRRVKEIIGPTGDPNSEAKVPISIWKEDSIRKTEFTSDAYKRDEYTHSNISGRHTMLLNKQYTHITDTPTTIVYTRFDTMPVDSRVASHVPDYGWTLTQDSFDQGAYYDEETNRIKYGTIDDDGSEIAGTTIRKDRRWETTSKYEGME